GSSGRGRGRWRARWSRGDGRARPEPGPRRRIAAKTAAPRLAGRPARRTGAAAADRWRGHPSWAWRRPRAPLGPKGEPMKERRLGPGGRLVSEVGLGGMYLSIDGRPEEAQAIRTIHAALEVGVTLIDTADVYCLDDGDLGHNERLIAKALRGRREQVVVA